MERQKVKCGLCHFEFDRGVSVCQGCQGNVVYGATDGETSDAAKTHGIIWAVGAMFLIYALPQILKSQLGWNVEPGWGFGGYSLVAVVAAGLWGAGRGGYLAAEAKSGWVRTFRRRW
jgi:hypothetical protein